MTQQPDRKTLTKISISTPSGVTVTIEAYEPMAAVAAEATALAERAAKTDDPGRAGPAVGFQADRRNTPPAQPSGMRYAPGPYPVQA